MRQVFCKCDGCGSERWVFWRWIKNGRSGGCKACARKLTPIQLNVLNESLLDRGMTWKVSGECRSGGRHRAYLAHCARCKEDEWILLPDLLARKNMPCPSCKANTFNRLGNPIRTEADRLLGLKFSAIKRVCKTKRVTCEWKDYQSFRYWALSEGYKVGGRLVREKRKYGFSAGNCYWTYKGDTTKSKMRKPQRKSSLKVTLVSTSPQPVPKAPVQVDRSSPLPILVPGISNQ